jgi:hypothetical protein
MAEVYASSVVVDTRWLQKNHEPKELPLNFVYGKSVHLKPEEQGLLHSALHN